MRNFGMHYYDSTIEGFVPSTFNPIPWGWYGVPGKPDEVMKKVEIPDLSESLDEMNFIMQMIERGTGATATQQGVQTESRITLGEVELALGQAQERSKTVSKFYTQAWLDRGNMFIKLIEAASDRLDVVKVYKEGKNTQDIYSREISPKDWITASGYRCRVWSQDERNKQSTDTLQKLNAVKAVMPFNKKLNEVYQRKLLEFASLTPEDTNAIMQEEKQTVEAMQQMPGIQPMVPSTTQPIIGPQPAQV